MHPRASLGANLGTKLRMVVSFGLCGKGCTDGTAGGGDLFPVVAVVLILRPVPPSDEGVLLGFRRREGLKNRGCTVFALKMPAMPLILLELGWLRRCLYGTIGRAFWAFL